MKRILLAALLFAGITASAQQPTSNLYLQTGSTPGYAKGSNTGASNTYGYKEYATFPTGHDTLRMVTQNTFTEIVLDSVQGQHTSPFVIMADTVGDTASFSNYPTGKATVWYKKNPFLLNRQCDEVKFTLLGNKTSWCTVKLGANINAGTLSGDTIHIAKVSASGGYAVVTLKYNFLRNAWILVGESTW